MNSAFLLWGQLLLGCFALAGVVLQLFRFGSPNESIRVLGALLNLSLSAILLAEGMGVFGWFPIFFYPPLYNILLSVLGFALPAFVYLGVLEHPTQIQRKIMWRLPLLGAFLGHVVLNAVPLFALGWLSSGGLLFWKRQGHSMAMRLFFCQIFFGLAYSWSMRLGWSGLSWVLFGTWIFGFQRLIEMFLVKNLVREQLAALPPKGVPL
jgi:hypothetical protein